MIKKHKTRLFLLILILFQAITGNSQTTNNLLDSTLNEQHKQILILNSWGTGLPIPDETKQGILIAIKDGGASLNDIFFEDLDLVRSPSSEHKLNLVSLLRNKLEPKQIGIVILIGSPSIEFIAKEGKELFPDAALIALITPNVNSLKDNPRKIIYIPWRVDPAASIKLAVELFPKTKHVFVITGAKDGVLPFIDEAKKAFIPWENKLDFEYSNKMTYEEMIQRASSLSDESIILYSTFFTDKSNRSFIPAEVVIDVCKESKVPVFATLEYYMGLGIVGGALLETESLGKQAGSIALDYLNGKIFLTEHITTFDSPIHNIVDWETINRFQSSKENIPENCIIVGKPPTLWEQYRQVVITVIIIFLILSTFIILLLFWNRRIQKMKTAAIEGEARFKVMIENAPYPIMVHAEREVIQLSEAWTKITGYSIKDIPNIVQWTSKAYGKDAVIYQEFIDKLYEIDSMQYDGEWEMTIKNGEKRILDFSTSPIGVLSDGRKAVITMAVDITERKNNEKKIKNQNIELIKAKEKAEESDRLKSAFLANMSHEIRTPLNGIQGFTTLLKEPNLSGKEQQRYIEIIHKSGDRMLNTVNDIIDISRIESGLIELSVSEVNISEHLKDLYSFFNHEAAKKGIQLVFNNDISESNYKCITDLEKFNSILTNLIKNAIKFTNQGTIELGVNIKEENGSAKLEFYVKDSGIGIPKDRQKAVFDRFVQADIEDKRADQGSGLGLTISKAYVEILGGSIWLDSQEGLGSTFYFTIDYNPVSESKSTKIDNEQILKEDNISKLKILVVEDDETSQYLISIVVDSFAKEIIKVISGKEAIEACRSNHDIDLILMDIRLPDMNGYDATQQIREFNKEVIIIAQTAHALTGDREKSIEAGCNDYITKPIEKEKLISLIQKQLKIHK